MHEKLTPFSHSVALQHSDDKSNEDAWSAQPWQASKFAHWFLEEGKVIDVQFWMHVQTLQCFNDNIVFFCNWRMKVLKLKISVSWYTAEKKPIDDISSSKNRDLLSLIVSSDKVGSHVSTVFYEKAIGNMPRFFPSENTEVALRVCNILSCNLYHSWKYRNILTQWKTRCMFRSSDVWGPWAVHLVWC